MFKFLKYLLLAFTPLLFYIIFSFILMFFPSSCEVKSKQKSTYIYSSLAHTEILLPINYLDKNLQAKFPKLLKRKNSGYLAISYGDRDFLMKVPTWEDIKIPLALKSLFLNTPALLRVGYYWDIDKSLCTKIELSDTSLQKLQQSIVSTFQQKDNHFIRYKDSLKQPQTFYFQAKNSYNLFHTCNSWTGDVLRDAGVSMPLITPFAQQVTYNLKDTPSLSH